MTVDLGLPCPKGSFDSAKRLESIRKANFFGNLPSLLGEQPHEEVSQPAAP